jgi:hypothetical protein
MTLRDLIETLEDLASEFGDDASVRLAHQPRWAFEYSIDEVQGVTLPATSERRRKENVIYISEGSQLGYLPHRAAVAIGWSERRDDEDDDEQEGGAR